MLKGTMKKAFIRFITFTMILSTMMFSNGMIRNAHAGGYPYGGKDGDLYWHIDYDGELEVSGTGDYEGYPDWMNYNGVIKTAKVNVSGITNCSKMFNNGWNLESIDLSGLDTSNVTDMSYMFDGCSKLTSIDCSGFKTSKVTTMASMFANCDEVVCINAYSFDTSKVVDMSSMFYYCSKLEYLDIDNFNTSNVTNTNCMFSYCYALTDMDLSGFDTSKLTNMNSMFFACNNLNTTIRISNSPTDYFGCFTSAAIKAGSKIVLEYDGISCSDELAQKILDTRSVTTDFTSNVELSYVGKVRIVNQSYCYYNAETGDTVGLYVDAQGKGLTYLWQYSTDPDGEAWGNTTQKTSQLTFTAKPAYHERSYRCKVTDQYGNTVYSQPTTLYITTLAIITQPSNVTVAAGKTATFKVKACGIGLSYLWQFSKDGKSWSNTTQKTETLSFTAAAAYSGRYYRCKVTDENGKTVTSNAAKLTVTSLAITSQPSYLTVAPKQTATFKVTATGTGLTYLWQFSKDGKSWSNTTQKTNTLSFTAAASHNGRYYRCKVTDSSGNTVTSEAAKLTVISLAIVTQPKGQAVTSGETVTFKVVAKGVGLTYLWQFSKNGTTWSNTTQKTATLSFTSAYAYNGRYYRCVITDAGGNTVTSNAAKFECTGK